MPPKRWFVTGARRGLGRAIVEAALARGDLVVATVRRADERGGLADLAPGRIWVAAADVRRPEEVTQAVAAAANAMDGIDVVVNNAGYGLFGAVEEVGSEELRAQMDVNLHGAWHVARAASRVLRDQHAGHLVQMSSVAGLVAGPGGAAYHASKFALEGMSEALAAELKPFGVHVTLVEPGPFRTDFAGDSVRVAAHRIAAYTHGAAAQKARLEAMHGTQPGDPAKAAAAILKLVDLPAPPVRLVLGRDAIRRARTRLAWVNAEVEASEALGGDTWYDDAPPDAGMPDFAPPTSPPRAEGFAPVPEPPPRSGRRPVVAVVGQSDPDEPLTLAAEAIGRGLVDAGFRVATGGLQGVMAAASRGARSSSSWRDGDVIAVLPGLDAAAANSWADVVVPTGLSHARNVVLVAMADVVVAVGGGAGTLSEIAMAWQHGKPIVALDQGDGWSARFAGHRVDHRREDVVHAAADASDVVGRVRRLLGG